MVDTRPRQLMHLLCRADINPPENFIEGSARVDGVDKGQYTAS
jgi:hypothetical protein